jgi:hypothetical protein
MHSRQDRLCRRSIVSLIIVEVYCDIVQIAIRCSLESDDLEFPGGRINHPNPRELEFAVVNCNPARLLKELMRVMGPYNCLIDIAQNGIDTIEPFNLVLRLLALSDVVDDRQENGSFRPLD